MKTSNPQNLLKNYNFLRSFEDFSAQQNQWLIRLFRIIKRNSLMFSIVYFLRKSTISDKFWRFQFFSLNAVQKIRLNTIIICCSLHRFAQTAFTLKLSSILNHYLWTVFELARSALLWKEVQATIQPSTNLKSLIFWLKKDLWLEEDLNNEIWSFLRPKDHKVFISFSIL